MSVEIIVNKETGETIKYKKKIFLDYICTEVIEEGDLDKINYIGIEKREELLKPLWKRVAINNNINHHNCLSLWLANEVLS